MAERRMFAKTIIDSDAFLDMPQSTQLLYFHLSMRADDDGFINNPKAIMRNVKCNEDDIKLLCAKKFIIPFESGLVVIKHWRIHNYIAKDRYKETKYKEEKATLMLDENNAYTQTVHELSTTCRQTVDKPSTQDRLGEVRLGEVRLESKRARFQKPTLQEVKDYIAEKGYNVDAERFVDYYESNGWRVGKNPMKDWKAAVRNWSKTDKTRTMYERAKTRNAFNEYPQRSYNFEDLETRLINKINGKENKDELHG